MKNLRPIVCIVLLLIGVCLSGCLENGNDDGNQQHNSENKFIGDWRIISASPDYDNWSFYVNGSTKNVYTYMFEGEPITTISWLDYSKDNTTLCLSTKNESISSPSYFSNCYSYSFSENATRLTLSSDGIVVMDLIKIL